MLFLLRKIRNKLLKENKIKSYLLYAIGEIILVVIGILIAVNINDWNTNKKNQDKTNTNLALLIESLEKDSVYYQSLIIQVEADVSKLNGMFNRLNKHTANLDTLKKIVIEEYSAGINVISFENDDPYQVMVQSGEITLLDKTLRKQLFSLYNSHERMAKSATETFNMNYQLVAQFRSKYGNPRLNQGPIFDAIWKDVRLVELASNFSGLIGARLTHDALTIRYLESLIPETNAILKKLKETR